MKKISKVEENERSSLNLSSTSKFKRENQRFQLMLYDAIIITLTCILFFSIDPDHFYSVGTICLQTLLITFSILIFRYVGGIYNQVWRYGGIVCYVRLILIDILCLIFLVILELFIPNSNRVAFSVLLSIWSISLLAALSIRLLYRYAYQYSRNDTKLGRFWTALLFAFAGRKIQKSAQAKEYSNQKIRIAIIGAGQSGVNLAEDLLKSENSSYVPICFVDLDESKAGRSLMDIPVYFESAQTLEKLKEIDIQEVVIAIPDLSETRKKELFEKYRNDGYKVKVYDYPTLQTADGKPHVREFDIEELLFRKPVNVINERTSNYYKDKTILITGGGGSIGSELCRQLAKMSPKQIMISDIYENGAYDVQQEMRISHKDEVKISIEIVSITNKPGMSKVFEKFHPEIIINAAAHKHVPLMEENCVEAVSNNVFGTKNLIDLCEEYGAECFMMVSTDKAVNPTNVMGATKRMCEMLVQNASTWGKAKYNCTRFGNVLGSAGSVIPLFKKQIAAGGPITLTDERIIRYFMTIPEAAQLILEAGAIAQNGELFVLDMGQPIKILDLAKNMIRLSGEPDIKIEVTGLREGEKLYEELLVKTSELDKTDNDLIFIERDTPFTKEEIEEKLKILVNACDANNDILAKKALKKVVPTYKSPKEVNNQIKKTD